MLKGYKFSKYNHLIELDENIYGYNAYSGGFCKFNDNIKAIIKNINFKDNEDINKLNTLPESIINELKKGRFIIDENIDEFSAIKTKHFLTRFSDTNSLGLTLIPTLACNFRCTYCFEADKGYENIKMNDDVINQVLTLIENRLKENGNLNIVWFGGEPLLAFDIIEKMQIRILEIVERKKLNLNTAIITNGYLLTEEISNSLNKLKINFVQITLDGSKEVHNKKRFLVNREGTFDKIILNILNSNKNLKINIRVNIEKDNINDINNFVDYLE